MKRCDLELLARDPAHFTVEIFNDARHICVNDLVDVWPGTKRYMVRGVGAKSKQYEDYPQLRKVIIEATAKRGPKREKTQLTLVGIPAGKKRAIEPISMEKWRRDFE